MTQPLSIGQTFATLDRRLATDPELRVVSNGQPFDDLAAAQGRAEELALTSMVDAIVVSDGARFWVYAVDEVAVSRRSLDTDVRGKLRLTLPQGVTLQSFMATYRTKSGEKLGLEKISAHQDGVPYFAHLLAQVGVPAYKVRQLRQGQIGKDLMERLRNDLIPRAAEPKVAAVLPYLDAALPLVADGKRTLRFDELATAVTGGRVAATTGAPEGTLRGALAGFAALKEHAQVTLASASHTHVASLDALRPLARLVGFDVQPHLVPAAAARGYLVLLAYYASVVRDLHSGALGSDSMDARACLDLAVKRLHDKRYNYYNLIAEMEADPAWSQAPVVISDGSRGPGPLSLDNAPRSKTGHAELQYDPVAVAKQLARLPMVRQVVSSVDSAAPESPAESARVAAVSTAHSLQLGRGIAQDSHLVPFTLGNATGVSPIEVKVVPFADRAALEQDKREGKVLGFELVDDVALVYTQKPIAELAREVLAKLPGQLPDVTVQQVREILRDDGAALAKALANEKSALLYRKIAGEVIDVAAMSALSGGVGGIVAKAAAKGAATALGTGSHVGVQAIIAESAGVLAGSATFTSGAAMAKGESATAADFAKDLVLFGSLSGVGRLANIGARMVPGTGLVPWLERKAIEHGGAITGATLITTGFAAFEAARHGRTFSEDEAQDELMKNAALATAIQGFGVVLGRFAPAAARDGVLREHRDRLAGRVRDALTRRDSAVAKYQALFKAYEAAAPGREREALDRALTGTHFEVVAAGQALGALRTDFAAFHQRFGSALGVQGLPASRVKPEPGPAAKSDAKAEAKTEAKAEPAPEVKVPGEAKARGPSFAKEPAEARLLWDAYHPQRVARSETEAQVRARVKSEEALSAIYRPQLDGMIKEMRARHGIAPGKELVDVERAFVDALRTFDPKRRATFLEHAQRQIKTDLVLERRGAQAIADIFAPGYKGPRPGGPADDLAAQRTAAETFLRETFTHRRDEMTLNLAASGKQVPNHDVAERATVADLRALIDKHGAQAPEWWKTKLAEAERKGQKTVEVGKLVPEVLAGLAQRGAPDRGAIAFHNLAQHHAPGGPSLEIAADRINAMRQPRQAYRDHAYTADEIDRILVDMRQKGQLTEAQLTEHRRLLALQLDLERRGLVTDYRGRERPAAPAARDAGGAS